MATLQKTIPSFLYQEWNDDDDLAAFVASYNAITQQYINTFNALNLPVYPSTLVAGLLLDWVALGLYGMSRPTLPSGLSRSIGPLNTWGPNDSIPLNDNILIGPANYFATSDDTFKRILTWHIFKGDGKVFNIRWLKRRVMRFLIGINGSAPNIDQTYQISVTFGVGNQVTIRIVQGVRTVIGGALLNAFQPNQPDYAVPNGLVTSFTSLTPIAEAPIFQAGVQARALELPFQFFWTVTVDNSPASTGFYNNGGELALFTTSGYPTSSIGLPAGAVWSNGLTVSVVPGVIPDPLAPPVYFGAINTQQLLLLGGGNLPLSNPGAGTLQLWNNGGVVAIA